MKESAQSMGIGKCLLDYVKSRKTELCLCVYEKNVHAIYFYQRENFLIQAEDPAENFPEQFLTDLFLFFIKT